MRLFLTAFLAALVSPALAAPPSVYLPKVEKDAQYYQAEPLRASFSDPATNAKTALVRLNSVLPATASFVLSTDGTQANLTRRADANLDAETEDLALGALYYSLVVSGFETIVLDGKRLQGSDFSRGAQLLTTPAAFALGNAVQGWVLLGDQVLTAATFARRVAEGDKAVFELLEAQLNEGPLLTRLALLQGIEHFPANRREGLLVARLSDPDRAVRALALENLPAKKSNEVLRGLEVVVANDNDNALRLQAVRALVGAGKSEYKRYLLLEDLGSKDSQVVAKAARDLAAAKDPKFYSAIAGLASHNDASIRLLAVTLLSELNDVKGLVTIVGSGDAPEDARLKAADWILKAADIPAKERGAAAGYLVLAAPSALAQLAGQKIAEDTLVSASAYLTQALSSSDPKVQAIAVEALGPLKQSDSIPALATLRQQTQDMGLQAKVDQAAQAILVAQPLNGVLALAESDQATVRAFAMRALVGFPAEQKNPKVRSLLMKTLGDSEATLRQAAAYALRQQKDAEALGAVAALVSDSVPAIRVEAIAALAARGSDADKAALMTALDDADKDVKIAALAALATLAHQPALAKAQNLLANRYPDVRVAALEAMIQLAKPADPALERHYTKVMLDREDSVKSTAIRALAAYRTADAAQAIGLPLIDGRSSNDVKIQALEALGDMQMPEAVEHAVRGLFADHRDVKLKALEALAMLKHESAVRPLQEFILSEDDAEILEKANGLLDIL